VHQQRHGQQAEHCPDGLASHKVVGRAEARLPAITADALKTIASPMTTSTSAAKYSHLSTPTRFAMRLASLL